MRNRNKKKSKRNQKKKVAKKVSQPSPVATSQLKGPTDAERQFKKATPESVDWFLEHGNFESDDEVESLSDNDDLTCSTSAMPEPRDMGDVCGGQSGKNNDLLAKMLDPNIGGKNRNLNGISGLVSQPRSENPRDRLKQKLRAMRRRRGKMADDDYVRDARGRKIPGARAYTQEDMAAGLGPRGGAANVDKSLTAQKRKEMLEKLRASMAEKQNHSLQY